MESETPFDIDEFLNNLTQRAGCYRMLDEKGEVIYVGKARNLRKRVSSYFQRAGASPKQQAMVARIRSIDVTVTHTESEALLLESQLIKRYRPRYNITLRDDKSYPYIHVSTGHEFPRVSFHRGAKSRQGRYFGPYPSAGAVRESLKTLQKIFPVRQCRDSFYENRSRPCLEYQIERCSAPCVGYIDQASYALDVRDTLMFLEGDGNQLVTALIDRMEKASDALNYEAAARYRDQIASLRKVLEQQAVHGEVGDLDIIACAMAANHASIHVVFIRSGQLIGDRTFFPSMPDEHTPEQVIEAFMIQYYPDKLIPASVILNHPLRERKLLEEFLTRQAGHNVRIQSNPRGDRARQLELAVMNAESALAARLTGQQGMLARFLSLAEVLHCRTVPERIECFDISHTQGNQTVASCVVFDQAGPVKSAYRRFNIEGITPGDDCGALKQAVSRRYRRIRNGEIQAPDLLFIDGGKPQVNAVREVLLEWGLDSLMTMGVAKGVDRRPGMEVLIPADTGQPFNLPVNSPALLLIQQIRDEAHRFAITGHRQRRSRQKGQSALEGIPGLGPKRRQQLLKQFGGLREISRAGVDSLSRVEGISRQLAQRIYENFQERET